MLIFEIGRYLIGRVCTLDRRVRVSSRMAALAELGAGALILSAQALIAALRRTHPIPSDLL
ncbi:hypothetical protein [Mycobacterium sp. D16Q16]|nr:hypothetical protein [Mycobacterium sp. D16Q16]